MDVGHVSVEATVIAAKPTAKTALKAASKPITASEEYSQQAQCQRTADEERQSDQTNATEAIHDKGGQHQSGQEGEFTDEVFQKNVIQMDVIVKVESAVSVHTAEAVIGHETVLEAVREQVRIDEVRFYDARIAEQGTTRFDPRERHLLKSARVKKDVTEDEIVETDISEGAVSVDDVFYGMVELDVDVRDVGQRRCPLFEIVAFEQLHVFGEP